MLWYTASSAAFWESSRAASVLMACSTPDCSLPGVLPFSRSGSSRPASASSISADKFSASDSCFSTRTDGWCMPRSSSLRYGLDRLVSSASWRSVRLASFRWLRMKEPKASIWASHWLAISLLLGGLSGLVAQYYRQPLAYRQPLRQRQPYARGHPEIAARKIGCSSGSLAGLLRRRGRTRGQQRRRGLEQVLGELPLAGQQLLGEVVGARHDVLRRGQLVGERQVHLWQLGLDRLDRGGPGLDRVHDCRLALA